MELTCTVSVSETLPLAGRFGPRGLNVHVVPLGRFEHWRFTVPVAPFSELTVMANFAESPTASVFEVGVMLPVKLGGVGAFLTTSVADTECIKEPVVPVTVNGYVPGDRFCV
jgi:hypothetical protein